MMRTTLAFLVVAAAATAIGAEPASLAFRPAEQEGYVAFDTGTLRGKVRLDGKLQGVCSVIYGPTGMELAKSVGLFSYYRVFSEGTRYLAAPIGIRRDAEAGLTAVLMALPEDCFAVSVPYNKEPADNVAAHGSVYLSLFGDDVAAGQTATAHCRLVIAADLTDEAVVRRYQQYLEER